MSAKTLRGIAAFAALVALTSGLTACSPTVPMEPAEGANDPACAKVTVNLPKTVSNLERRTTNAQATGAWGDPAGVELRCGVPTSGPTTDLCVTVNDVDWIIDESQAPLYRFEAYGREPGLEVFVNSELASGTLAATDLANVAKMLPQVRKCTGYDTARSVDQ
ncbi:MAG: DUF3515 domain-containing protein [Actinobacteria bacterium]|nr:DUF3515 domain-containing protein [Actinomycetota bacterium]